MGCLDSLQISPFELAYGLSICKAHSNATVCLIVDNRTDVSVIFSRTLTDNRTQCLDRMNTFHASSQAMFLESVNISFKRFFLHFLREIMIMQYLVFDKTVPVSRKGNLLIHDRGCGNRCWNTSFPIPNPHARSRPKFIISRRRIIQVIIHKGINYGTQRNRRLICRVRHSS